jgi:hypothetical protein
MPDKNEELNEAEMEQASGGGIEGQRTADRQGLSGSVEGETADPLGAPTNTEPGGPGGLGGQVKS